ncbi:Biotin transporter BioY [Pseudoclavibacter triregionum]|nr:Biotin transporter BioY [Pseudoclavibacter triregionum]
MSTTALPASRGTVLADRFVRSRGLAKDAMLVLAGAALVALLAQVSIPMWPVPITGQTLGVMVAGAALGAWRGAAAMVTYMVAGLAGLPVFAGFTGGLATLGKPSFGYIIGFIVAAFLAGWLAERRWDRRPLLSIAVFGLATLVPFLIGVPYMAAVLAAMGQPVDAMGAINMGVTPFIIGGLVKWAIAAAVLPLAWRAVKALDERS